MSKFEFIRYEPVQDEKHLGIATVKLYDKIIAKFKIVPNKDGNSFFPAAPSVKIGEKYSSAILLDSNFDKEELDTLIKECVRAAMNGVSLATPQPTYMQPTFLPECPF